LTQQSDKEEHYGRAGLIIIKCEKEIYTKVCLLPLIHCIILCDSATGADTNLAALIL